MQHDTVTDPFPEDTTAETPTDEVYVSGSCFKRSAGPCGDIICPYCVRWAFEDHETVCTSSLNGHVSTCTHWSAR